MRNASIVVGFALSAAVIMGFVVFGMAEGNWWRLFLLLTLWPMGRGAKDLWRRSADTPREDSVLAGRTEQPTDPPRE